MSEQTLSLEQLWNIGALLYKKHERIAELEAEVARLKQELVDANGCLATWRDGLHKAVQERDEARQQLKRWQDAIFPFKTLEEVQASVCDSVLKIDTLGQKLREAQERAGQIWAWLESNVRWLDVPRVRASCEQALRNQQPEQCSCECHNDGEPWCDVCFTEHCKQQPEQEGA